MPFTVCCRVCSQVNSNIENRFFNHPHQLCLGIMLSISQIIKIAGSGGMTMATLYMWEILVRRGEAWVYDSVRLQVHKVIIALIISSKELLCLLFRYFFIYHIFKKLKLIPFATSIFTYFFNFIFILHT